MRLTCRMRKRCAMSKDNFTYIILHKGIIREKERERERNIEEKEKII